MTRFAIASACILATSLPVVQADTLHVPGTYSTIQAAIDAAVAGDVVLMADGIYTGEGNKNLHLDGKAITVRGENGAAHCIIDCQNDGRGIDFFETTETAASVIEGLTITHGQADFGGGIRLDGVSAPTFRACVVSNCTADTRGGGIYIDGWGGHFSGCIVRNNHSNGTGGGIECRGCGPKYSNLIVHGNTATTAGAGFYFHVTQPTLINCTIVGNSTGGNGGGVACDGGAHPTITNTIIRGNAPEAIYLSSVSDSAPVRNSNIEGGWLGTANIDADPAFALPFDFHLTPSSPCVDAGTVPRSGDLPLVDFDGNPRSLDGNGDGMAKPDIGAYEFDPVPPTIAVSPAALNFSAFSDGPAPPPEQLTVRNAANGTLTWEVAETCPWLDVTPLTGDSVGEEDQLVVTVTSAGLPHGVHHCVINISDPQANNTPYAVTATLRICGMLRVPAHFPTIQAAIDAAANGDIIVVADGTYTGEGNRNLDFHGMAIAVRSENGPANCTIDCEGLGRGFSLHSGETTDSIIDGFTIVNGRSLRSGGGICVSSGSAATISNCILRHNAADNGGGIECYGNTVISDCIIAGNMASEGGGIWCGGTPMITNCFIHGNIAATGAGVCATASEPVIVNCTVTNNVAARFGGGISTLSEDTDAVLANCIVWNNQPEQLAMLSGMLTVTHSDVEGGDNAVYLGYGGMVHPTLNWDASNIDADPDFAFASGPHLVAGSPCIDAGTNTPGGGLVALPTSDLDGSTRPLDGDGDTQAIADMGVHEFGPSAPSIALSTPAIEFFIEEGAAPAEQTLSLHNAGGATLNWQINVGCDWLTADPLAGSASADAVDVALEASAAGLAHGDYPCTLMIADAAAVNSPRWVHAILHVNRALSVPAEFATIQAAIDAAVDGDAVVVADGRYTGAGNTGLDYRGKAVTIRSENGPTNCIIDSEGGGTAVYFRSCEDAHAILEGVTLTKGEAAISTALASPTIRNCVVTEQRSESGCVSLQGGQPRMSDCVIASNATGLNIQSCGVMLERCTIANNDSGGIHTQGGALRLESCIIRDNRDEGYTTGIYASNSKIDLSNCLMIGNAGGVISSSVAPSINLTNCTIINNGPNDSEAPMLFSSSGNVRISNCIIRNGTALEVCLPGGPMTIAFSDVQGGSAAVQVGPFATLDWGDGNIDADPLFVFPSDPHLGSGSPCVDAGTNAPGSEPAALPLTDLDGNPRPLDGDGNGSAIADMGAYEFNPAEPALAASPAKIEFLGAAVGTNPPDETLSIRNAGGGTLAWTITENCPWLTIEPLSGISTGEIDQAILRADITGLTEGSYSCEVIVSDPAAVNDPRTVFVNLQIAPTQRVPSEYATIQAAIDAADEDNIVLVADGTYTGEGNKYIEFGGKAITVRSENGPANCILDCEGDGRAFCFRAGEGLDASVIGFTIANGRSTNGGAVLCDGSSPTFRNCILRDCSATYHGGAVFCRGSNASFTNCAIIDCAATVYGGGVYCYGSNPTLANCTITGSLADRGSGVYCFDSSPTITNTLIWGGDDQALYVSSGTPTVTCCNVQGGWPGATNLDANPMLAGDGLHLTGGSPCMDAGDPAAFYSGQTDLDGQPRRLYAAADIGADEFAWTADFDLDADVDLADFSLFQSCFNGPNRPPARANCDAVDVDADSDVDVADFGVFGGCFNGPNRQPRCL